MGHNEDVAAVIPVWWSIALTTLGVIGLYLTMRKQLAGPIIGAGVQVLWIAYAIATEQWGFIASALIYGAVNVYGIQRWNTEKATA